MTAPGLPATRPGEPHVAVPAAAQRMDLVEAAFRDLHGARLLGFAQLVTLGDARSAASAAGHALNQGARRAEELRHPERAAAWLRARVLKLLPRRDARRTEAAEAAARARLERLGVSRLAFDGLAALPRPERAVLVASDIERFEPTDLETIAGRDHGATRQLATSARRRYLAAMSLSLDGEPAPSSQAGELAERVRSIAERAVGTTWPDR